MEQDKKHKEVTIRRLSKIEKDAKKYGSKLNDNLLKLHLGCGLNRMEGWVNVDKYKLKGVDVVQNLDAFPYPFKSNSVSYVVSSNVFEHLHDIPKVMDELHRICVNHALIKIIVPYYLGSGAYHDITHKHFYTSKSFNTFTDWDVNSYYCSESRFRLLRVYTRFTRRDWLLNKPIEWIMNIGFIRKLNERMYPLSIPMQEIEFDLEVVK